MDDPDAAKNYIYGLEDLNGLTPAIIRDVPNIPLVQLGNKVIRAMNENRLDDAKRYLSGNMVGLRRFQVIVDIAAQLGLQ